MSPKAPPSSTFLLALAATFVVACSGAASDRDGTESDSGTGADRASPSEGHDSGAKPDALGSPDSAAKPDGASPGDASPPHDAASLLTPDPPAGAVKCGSGMITESSSTMACMMPNWVLDDMVLPDGGTTMVPRNCGAVTVASGTWEVWCTKTQAYIWAEWDTVTNTNMLKDCHGASILMLDEGIYSSGSGGGNGVQVGTFELDGTEISGLIPSMPENLVMTTTVANPSSGGGSAELFALGSLEDSCKMGAFDTPTVVAGVTVTWK
jgi:hypothetical protein